MWTLFEGIHINHGNRYTKEIAPHKLCLLLAVIQAIEEGEIQDNKIRYDEQLLERYNYYYKLIRPNIKSTKFHYPFIHMDSANFWNLHNYCGQILEFSSSERTNLAMNSSKIPEKIGFASLHKDLFTHLQDANYRKILRNKFIDHWFQRASDHKQRFLNNLNKLKELYPREKWRKVSEKRSSAFRKIILNAYENTCAASGSKLKGVDGSPLLEAAHIIPLEVTTDNRPQNGMALLPTIHVGNGPKLDSPWT